jgi:eukaryotic-like serine/threonine-protein kinase
LPADDPPRNPRDRPPADQQPLPALIAGRYRVQERLTRGGMGEILVALDQTSGKRVALKRQLKDLASKTSVMMFEREYHTLASLKHPCIVEVYDYGIDGVPFFTMELLDGRDLTGIAPVPYHEACRYLRDVASSLALLHARHLLHRDVSPRNVRITTDGRCKLLDFGALTSFGLPEQVIGTPPGTPPEALYGLPLDQRLDLYALGIRIKSANQKAAPNCFDSAR